MAAKRAKNIRLSKHIVPNRYSITLIPDLDEFTFTGEEEILLTLTKSTKEITLHAAELEIASATLNHGSSQLISQKISYDEKQETATISFEKTIQVSKAWLKLKFSGILNDKMRGFYKSKYEVEGKTHHMAVTQFESTDARRAFPSFDEPAKKAVFDVKLVIPNDHTAISNTIETEVAEHSPGYNIVTFAPTPKMSTYLLAFIVGRFEHIETHSSASGGSGQAKGVKVRVFVTKGKKKQAEFALEVAAKILSFYSEYFKIPYPLPVLDLIAIPDFASGAMENWGAITYRETALLFDPELSSTANKQQVALVIAHEIAHMWFGNLVTMEWWTHLWLNEGFASYIEYLAVDHLFPNWHVWTQFVYMDHAKALALDGLKNTHAIEVEVHHPKEISEIFDEVCYSKGASVIRMLASYLGPKNFQKGLRFYLKKHQYSSAKTSDLWAALEKVSGRPIKKMMQNWTGKPGYPLITILGQNKHLLLSQSRFFSSSLSQQQAKDKTLWSIPIDIKTSKNKKPVSYFFSKKSILVTKPKDGEWMKANFGETSFVRINYPPSYLKLLQEPIREKELLPQDRFGILCDIFMLAQSGHRSTVDALKLTLAYKNEEEYIVWAEIASDLRTIDNLIAYETFYDSYKRFSRRVFGPIAAKVGWNKKQDESHTQTLLRSVAIYGLGTNGDEKTIQKAKDLFEVVLNEHSKLDSDLRGIVYNLVAENGERKEYLQFRNLYKKTSLHEEKDRILRALCAFKNKDLLKEVLQFAFSKDMRAQDQFKAINFVFANSFGREIAWDFVKIHWKSIVEQFGGGHLFPRFIKPAVHFIDKAKAKEIEEFFKRNPSHGLERTVAQVVEQIYANSEWLERDRNKISIFLKKC